LEGSFLGVDEYVGKDPAKLAVKSHDALALLGEESSRLGRKIRRPGLPFFRVGPVQPDAMSTLSHVNVRTSDRIRHAVSKAIVAASAGPGSSACGALTATHESKRRGAR